MRDEEYERGNYLGRTKTEINSVPNFRVVDKKSSDFVAIKFKMFITWITIS
jgi:hypothetical protein